MKPVSIFNIVLFGMILLIMNPMIMNPTIVEARVSGAFVIQDSSAYLPFNISITHTPTQNKTVDRQATSNCRSCILIDHPSYFTLSINETTSYLLKYGISYGEKINQTIGLTIRSNNKVVNQITLPVQDDRVDLSFVITTTEAPKFPTPAEILSLQLPFLITIPDLRDDVRDAIIRINDTFFIIGPLSLLGAVSGLCAVGLVIYYIKTKGEGGKLVMKYVGGSINWGNMDDAEQLQYEQLLKKELEFVRTHEEKRGGQY